MITNRIIIDFKFYYLNGILSMDIIRTKYVHNLNKRKRNLNKSFKIVLKKCSKFFFVFTLSILRCSFNEINHFVKTFSFVLIYLSYNKLYRE